MENNPLLQPEDYFQGYQKSIEDLKHNPQILEFDKLTYELFEHQEVGRKWLELAIERYILAPAGTPGSPTFANEVMWGEGVRYPFLLIRAAIKAHKQRIHAEGHK